MTATVLQPRAALAVVVALCVVLGIIAELPHLADDAWQDEAATLMVFASRGAAHAFRDYSMPNNHMLFSATLSLWWARGDSVLHARLLPGLVLLLSTGLLLVVGRRSLGWPATALGLALWSGSALAAVFGLALRGYAFSWPFTLLLFSACQGFIVDGRRWAMPLLLAAGVASLAILPSNVMVLAVCVTWAVLRARIEHGVWRYGSLRRAIFAVFAGLLGVLIYLPHRAELRQHMLNGFSQWSGHEVWSHWLLASSLAYWPLLPLLLLGMWSIKWKSAASEAQEARSTLALGASLLVVLPLAVYLSPTPLVPRALVPILPLWCLAMGGLLAQACAYLSARWPHARNYGLAAAAVLCFSLGHWMPACGGFEGRFPAGDDLCHQYYRHDYRPASLMRAIDQRFGGEPVLLDPGTLWPLAFVQWNTGLQHAVLRDISQWPRGKDAPLPRLLVSDTPEHARVLLARVSTSQAKSIELLLDSGVLKLYRVAW